MSEKVQVFRYAHALPLEWDEIASANPFLHKKCLQVLETANPCGQQYYYAASEDAGSIAVSYRHRLNVLTFARLPYLGIPLRIIGIPASISSCGYVLQGKSGCMLRNHISQLPGISLVLNAPQVSDWPDWPSGATLPDCVLQLHAEGFDAWLASLRSPYRRRVRAARGKWQNVSVECLEPHCFSEEDYALYSAVWKKSESKLECLPSQYFQSFPGELLRFRAGRSVLGFVQLLQHEQTLYFLFGGMNYALRDEYDTYWNMLLVVIREGFTRGCRNVSLGQTTESVKLRLGCQMVSRYFCGWHRNGLLQKGLRYAAPVLAYKQPEGVYHVFRS
jgi:hypothetical protein